MTLMKSQVSNLPVGSTYVCQLQRESTGLTDSYLTASQTAAPDPPA